MPTEYTLRGQRLLRLRDVIARTGLKKSSIYSYMRAGLFPAHVRVGRLLSAWVESDVDKWIEEQIARGRSE